MTIKPTGLMATRLALYPYSFTNLPKAPWVPFNSESPFNTLVGSSPTIASKSATWISKITPRLESKEVGFSTETGSEDYEHPITFALSTDPLHKLKMEPPESYGTDYLTGLEVHIPTGAEPAGGEDGHLCIYDQPAGRVYDLWQVKSSKIGATGEVKASWGGYESITGNGMAEKGSAVAGGFSVAEGLIRGEELIAGAINHALFLVTDYCWSYEAPFGNSGRHEGGAGKEEWPPMGGHLWLDSTPTEITALGKPAWQNIILNALHSYGAYVGDTGGGVFKTIGPTTYSAAGLPNPLWEYGEAHEGTEGISNTGTNSFFQMDTTIKSLLSGGHFHFIT